MIFSDKYKLTREQSVFLAKKKMDENIYCGMKMENRAVTFPQTKTILSGVNVAGVQLDDIQAILNMRDAWRFLLTSIDEPVNVEYMCRLNEFIARNEALKWGVLRGGSVGISGCDYVPPIPEYETVKRELEAILSQDKTATGIALDVFAWGARGQFFWDGYKRTSLTMANKIMVSQGVGMLTILDKNMEAFNELLLRYYNSGIADELKLFMYENAIQGMTA
ncbi:MAG TPA: death-on-curing protein [Firmicutes bacterium]|nr:death-on-curing protein [Bacillota bacterium]